MLPIKIAYYDAVEQSRQDWWQSRLTQHLGPCQLICLDDDEAMSAEIALVWSPPLGRLRQLNHLKLIISLGQGVDHLLKDPDLPRNDAEQEIIPIVRLVDPDMSHALSHWVILAVLDYLRDGPAYRRAADEKIFSPFPQRQTIGLPVAVYGMGAIGHVIAERLRALGFDVHGWSRTQRSFGADIKAYHGREGFHAMLGLCQIHICILPLTSETINLFNKAAFDMMPKGAYFINGGRGRHVVEADLLTAISSSHLEGACLDVFVEEPLPPTHPFWDEPAITIWPHVAAQTNPDSAGEQVAAAIKAVLENRAPANQVDLERGY